MDPTNKFFLVFDLLLDHGEGILQDALSVVITIEAYDFFPLSITK